MGGEKKYIQTHMNIKIIKKYDTTSAESDGLWKFYTHNTRGYCK